VRGQYASLAALAVMLGLWVAAAPAAADALFEAQDPLALELRAPYRDMTWSGDKTLTWPGRLQTGGEGFDIELSLRGNHRLAACRYPPLRLYFDKAQIKDTLFEHQKDIKLVVQCDDGSDFADYLRTEYLIYRALLTLTDMAYRVRWVQIDYVDTERGNRRRSAPGFLVERKSRVAKRHGLGKTDVESIPPESLEPDQAALTGLFAYLISNADYSIITGSAGEPCCHNAKLLVDDAGRHHALLYDFDNAGVVNTSYAVAKPSIGVRRVTQRKYRGYCVHEEAVRGARERLLAQRAAVTALFEDDPVLSRGQRRWTLRFLGEGFDRLADARRFEAEVIQACR
jgi:hypothetical protein